MVAELLDRPIWTALTSRQAQFAIGAGFALRYRPTVEPFISAADDSEASIAALGALIGKDEDLYLLQRTASPVPPGIEEVSRSLGVQMLAETAARIDVPANVTALGDAEAPEMMALAELCRPGPFRSETHRLGTFWGIRESGRLVAMAGERMKVPGMTEVSGVATHPDARGRGYARLLSRLVMAKIVERGERPFLHAYADNAAAIGLYEELGFSIRTEMQVQVFRRAD